MSCCVGSLLGRMEFVSDGGVALRGVFNTDGHRFGARSSHRFFVAIATLKRICLLLTQRSFDSFVTQSRFNTTRMIVEWDSAALRHGIE